MVRIATYVPIGLIVAGVAKAGALVWIGPQIGIPLWAISLAGALWITGPATVLWFWNRRHLAHTDGAPFATQT